MKGLKGFKFSISKSFIIEFLILLLIILSIVFFIKPIKVSGHSMDGALKDSDLILISKQAYRLFGSPESGDIVVFPYENTYGKRLFVKRIIATEGQRLQIKNNKVIVDGKLQEETYIGKNKTDGNIDLVIPKNQVFVMGDNRENSTDSRSFGTINIKDITGKVFLRLYPFQRFGGVE